MNFYWAGAGSFVFFMLIGVLGLYVPGDLPDPSVELLVILEA